MPRRFHPFERESNVAIHPPSFPPLPSYTKPGIARVQASPSDGKISTVVLLVIVILAVIFFVCGILHLLVRFVMKRPYSYSFSRYRRNPDRSSSDVLQRQLQQLFRLHDCGLDQHIIDALPVFCYKEIAGSKEPFDCAVCLCAFSDNDNLRLLPDCSHAFHVNCIDTWLLSNSTCPLCRGTLVCAHYSFENQLLSNNEVGSGRYTHQKPTIMEEPAGERRVYSVRLGKFRSVCNEGVGSSKTENGVGESSSSSSSKLDARRCYSLGSCQYVIADSDLLVSLSDGLETDVGNKGIAVKLDKTRGRIGSSLADGDVEAKRISSSNKGESFSVSKIWQWSKKGKFLSSSDANVSRGDPL